MKLIDRVRQRRRDAATLKGLFETSEQRAAERGDERVGAEHLMLAAFDLPEESAQAAFAAANADWTQFAPAIDTQRAAALEKLGVPPELDPDSTPAPTKRFAQFDATYEAAIQATYRAHEKDGALCGAHVVAGICAVERGVAARALAAMDLSRSALREAAMSVAAAHSQAR